MSYVNPFVQSLTSYRTTGRVDEKLMTILGVVENALPTEFYGLRQAVAAMVQKSERSAAFASRANEAKVANEGTKPAARNDSLDDGLDTTPEASAFSGSNEGIVRRKRRIYPVCANCFVSEPAIMQTPGDTVSSQKTCPRCGPQTHVFVYVSSDERIKTLGDFSMETAALKSRSKAPLLTGRVSTIKERSSKRVAADGDTAILDGNYWISLVGVEGSIEWNPSSFTAQNNDKEYSVYNELRVVSGDSFSVVPMFRVLGNASPTLIGYMNNERDMATKNKSYYYAVTNDFKLGPLLGVGSHGAVFSAEFNILQQGIDGIGQKITVRKAVKIDFLRLDRIRGTGFQRGSDILAGKIESSKTSGSAKTFALGVLDEDAGIYHEAGLGKLLKMHDPRNIYALLYPDFLFSIVFPSSGHVAMVMVMPLLAGSVGNVVKPLNTTQLRIPYCKGLLHRLLRTLAHCHSQGFCHADIKTANVLGARTIRSSGEAEECGSASFICDFSLSTFGTPQTSPCMTDEYRPPEVWLGFAWNEKVDIWGLGCVAMEILMAGQFFVDFSGKGAYSVADGSKKGRREYLSAICRFFGPIPKHMYPLEKRAQDDAAFASHRDNAGTESFASYIDQGRSRFSHTSPRSSELADLIDLITKLLTIDPAYRPSAADALRHRFFSE